MEKIASFTVNHLDLEPGVYLSRTDLVGGIRLGTFDLRMTRPNREPVMNTAEMHAIEHLGATWLRTVSEWKDRVVYFGPMGCRTGFYLILAGIDDPAVVAGICTAMFRFISEYEGEIPGASARDCGNWQDMNLPMARWEAARYLERALLAAGGCPVRYPD